MAQNVQFWSPPNIKCFSHRYETINIDLTSKPQWFLAKNPLGKVPTIQVDNEIYYESLPVCDYLDEAFPGRKLLPSKPEEKVKDRMALTHFDMAIGWYYKILRTENPKDQHEALNQFR